MTHLDRVLTILEVSRKQDYIFSSKKLRENADRSNEIAYVTGSEFFRESAKNLYDEQRNMVYAGGGHTVLQFDSADQAVAFTRAVTEDALRRFEGMEIFAKTLPYDESKTPGENLNALSAALERKKAFRQSSFRQMSFGIEALDSLQNYRPQCAEKTDREKIPENLLAPPEGWEYPKQLADLSGDNFIAVVHIDGNAMGNRVSSLYKNCGTDWESCRKSLRRFSDGIQADFEMAFRQTVQTLLTSDYVLTPPMLPIRPIILAGDDVCFVADGKIGLEGARIFLEHLTALTNQEDKGSYAACAGVALVHQKYPFHQAYNLAEELCSSAKRYGSSIDKDGRVSAMDWHIEFGQLKENLSEIRKDYETEDGCRLELRPVTVIVPDGVNASPAGQRSYDFFRAMCSAMKNEYGNIARSKIKDLREALKQGEVESEFFLQDKKVQDLLYHGFTVMHRTDRERADIYREMFNNGGKLYKKAFADFDGMRRCLFFDAIEMIDHCDFLEVVE